MTIVHLLQFPFFSFLFFKGVCAGWRGGDSALETDSEDKEENNSQKKIGLLMMMICETPNL